MTRDTKPTNPKDVIGSGKLSLELVPPVLMAEAATAFYEGAAKYGRFNWRIAGVRASIYYAAEQRHMKKWWNGEDRDPKTRVKHLGNALACIGILLDAELQGMLTDDRPPAQPGFSEYIDELAGTIAHLKALFADHSPKQYTIADTADEVVFTPIPKTTVIYHTNDRPVGYRVGDDHSGPGSVSPLRDRS